MTRSGRPPRTWAVSLAAASGSVSRRTCWPARPAGGRSRPPGAVGRWPSRPARSPPSTCATAAGRPRWAVGWAPLAAAITLVVAVVGLLLGDRQPAQPAPIAAAVASYRTRTPAWSGPAHPPPVQQVGDLRWRGSGRGTLAGLPVVAHTYQDPAGHRILLLQADRSFPTAVGAHHPAGSDTWVSEIDGVVLFCTDHPTPSLVLGQDRAIVLRAASRLGLDLRGQEGGP